MAKLKTPFLSFKAYGQLTKDFVLRRHAKDTIAEKKPLPADANTPLQQLQRNIFKTARDEWHLLDPTEKAVYEKYGTQHHMTGYAWFMRAFLLNPAPRTFLQLEDTPDSYTTKGGKQVSVKVAEDGLEFTAPYIPIPEGRAKSATQTFLTLPGVDITQITTALLQIDRIRYSPIYVSTPITVTAIVLEIVTAAAAGKKARIAIYNADTDWQPTTLILDAGEFLTDALGLVTINISQVLTPGRYLAAIHANAQIGLRMARGGLKYLGLNPDLGTITGNCTIQAIYKAANYAPWNVPGTPWDTATYRNDPSEHLIFFQIGTP